MRWVSSRLDGKKLEVVLSLNPGATIVRAFPLRNPERVAIDVSGGVPLKSHTVTGNREIERIRVGKVDSGTRIVVDLTRSPGTPVIGKSSVSIPLN